MMNNKVERRRHKRYRFASIVEVEWFDSDNLFQYALGYGLDVSSGGIAVVLPVPAPVGGSVWVRVNGTKVLGKATVRYAANDHSSFRIGMEFDAPLVVDLLTRSTSALRVDPVLELEWISIKSIARHSAQHLLMSVRKILCFLSGHTYSWTAYSSNRANVKCSRCKQALQISFSTEVPPPSTMEKSAFL